MSLKTASRALNGHPNVTPETRAKVQAASAELGFRLDGIARELRSGATSVGLIIGDLANPFYPRIARGVERVLRSRGLQLVTTSTDESAEVERAVAGGLVERRVRALLIVPSSTDQAYLDVERRHGLPVVFLDRPPVGVAADTILLDNRAGARAATEHLLAGGHRRIGVLQALRALGGGQALFGFDDFDLADLLGITVVAHDPVEMGRIAAETALSRLDGDEVGPRTVVLPTWLMPRGSGELPPPR